MTGGKRSAVGCRGFPFFRPKILQSKGIGEENPVVAKPVEPDEETGAYSERKCASFTFD